MTTTLLKIETRQLPCPLTNDELLAKGDALATCLRAIDDEKSAQEQQKAEMKERIADLETTKGRLRTEIQERREWRAVHVEIRLKDARQALVTEVRTDTGEILRERFMDDDERSQPLPGMGA